MVNLSHCNRGHKLMKCALESDDSGNENQQIFKNSVTPVQLTCHKCNKSELDKSEQGYFACDYRCKSALLHMGTGESSIFALCSDCYLEPPDNQITEEHFQGFAIDKSSITNEVFKDLTFTVKPKS